MPNYYGRGGGGSSSGAPTFVSPDTWERQEQVVLGPLALQEQIQHSDSIVFKKLLDQEKYDRADTTKLPSFAPIFAERWQRPDQIIFNPMKINETEQRSDLATISLTFKVINANNTMSAPKTTTYKLEAWGGGAPGGTGAAAFGASGGAGAAYARTTALSITAGTTITFNVASSTTPAGNNGQSSWISTTGVAPTSTSNGVLAVGGLHGNNGGTTSAGAAVTASSAGSIGNTIFTGGNSLAGSGTAGGAGGGCAGSNANATGQTGGSPDGGNGGNGGTNAGAQPGGSGGGGGAPLGTAGAGAFGQVRISWSV